MKFFFCVLNEKDVLAGTNLIDRSFFHDLTPEQMFHTEAPYYSEVFSVGQNSFCFYRPVISDISALL